jgi:hypothetical protein
MAVSAGVAARGGVGALGGVAARGGVGAIGGVAAQGGVGALGSVRMGHTLRLLPTCQRYLDLFIFLVVGQAGHNSTSFLATLLVIDDQWSPRA